jgi:hypothetical protein
MRDNATEAAIKVKWDATPAIVAAIPGGLKDPPWPTDTMLYPMATMDVNKNGAKANQQSACGEIDFRRATIIIYGLVQSELSDAFDLVYAAFVSTPTNRKTLTIDGATHMRTEGPPSNSGGILERGERVALGQIWKATLVMEIWSSYIYPT